MVKCYNLIKDLQGKPPRGTCAPFNRLSSSQADILEDLGVEYDNSLSQHDCLPYWFRDGDSWTKVDYSKPAEEWMKPFKFGKRMRNIVEIPCSWYMEDMMPMQYLANIPNSVSIQARLNFLVLSAAEWLGRSSHRGIYMEGEIRIFLRKL